MIDLNKINGGLQLINYIMRTQQKNKPWSKEKLSQNLMKLPNTHNKRTRSAK